MSSLNLDNPYENFISEKQFNGFTVPLQNAKIIKDAIQNDTAPFLPKENGEVEIIPIYNGNTGFILNTKDLIPLQILNENKENIVVTYNTVNNAGTRINKDEKGFFYNFQRDDKTIGTSQFFFPSQTEDPDLLKNKIESKIKTFKLNATLEINTPNPEDYLAKYIAACKSGAKLLVNSEIVEKFKENFTTVLNNQYKRRENKELDSLSAFFFKVDLKANSINKELFAEVKRENQKEQNQSKKKEQEVEMAF